MSGAIEGLIVHHDAYYACDWKKLVSDAETTEDAISLEDSDTKWPLARKNIPGNLGEFRDDDPIFDEENIPTNLGSAFAITGDTYRAIEDAGDPSSVLKYFRPVIIYWTGASDIEDVTRVFDNRNGYKILSFLTPVPGYPYYEISFNFMGLDPKEELPSPVSPGIWTPYLTGRMNIPDPGEFYSQPDLKDDSAAPIPFIELESLESLEFMTDPKTDFPTMLQTAIAETHQNMATPEAIDDIMVIYAGISHVVPLPNLNQDFLNKLPKSVRESWSLSRGNPFVRLQIIHNLVKEPRLSGSLGPYPVNEIYGGGQDDAGNVVENHYNDDLLIEINSLSLITTELVNSGVLASLDIYSY